MGRLVEFPLDDGSYVLVEVEEPENDGLRRVGREEVVERATQTFDEALDKIRPASEAILKRLQTLSQAPDEITVEFGLKLSAEAGAFVCSGKVEANYTVTLKWKRDPAHP
jgi:prefoldin subunit 5